MEWIELYAKWKVIGGMIGGTIGFIVVVWFLVSTWKEANTCYHDPHTRWKNGHSYVKCIKCGKRWED